MIQPSQRSHTPEALVLQVELHKLLAHHVQLRLVVLLYDHLLRFRLVKLFLQLSGDLLLLRCHAIELLFPLTVLLHDLKRATLAQSIDALHLVRHLADLHERFLLQQHQLLLVRATARCKLIGRHHLLASCLLDRKAPLLKASEHVTEQVEVLLRCLRLQQRRHMIHLVHVRLRQELLALVRRPPMTDVASLRYRLLSGGQELRLWRLSRLRTCADHLRIDRGSDL